LETTIEKYGQKLVSTVSKTSKVFEPLVNEFEISITVRNDQISSLEKELAGLRIYCKLQEENISTMTSCIKQNNTTILELQDWMNEKSKAIRNLKSVNDELRSNIHDLSKELEKTVDQREENTNLKKANVCLEEKCADLEKLNDVNVNNIKNYVEKIEEHDYYNDVRKKIFGSQRKEIANLKNANERQTVIIVELEEKNKKLIISNGVQANMIRDGGEKFDKLSQSHEQQSKLIMVLEEKIKDLITTNSVQADTIRYHSERIDEINGYRVLGSEVIRSQRVQIDEQLRRIETLEGLVKEGERVIKRRNEENRSLFGDYYCYDTQMISEWNNMDDAFIWAIKCHHEFPDTRIMITNSSDETLVIVNPNIEKEHVFSMSKW
jgi:DNA repair exonuclease SbcCD ATPase subunit